jgi:hypothetical protein
MQFFAYFLKRKVLSKFWIEVIETHNLDNVARKLESVIVPMRRRSELR